MIRTRKQYPSALKAKIVLEMLRETKTITELASEYQIHPNLITKWKQAAIADLPALFERSAATDEKALEARADEYETPGDVREGLSRYPSLYKNEQLHRSLGYRTPAQVYYKNAR